ncbi:Na+/melibiose symporter-like transporter [Sphingomonas sp. PP-CC-3G-468]|nr:Na+/melibiose symporter-like transporter [Sphingomonas sp. PP-CC-3G-468]
MAAYNPPGRSRQWLSATMIPYLVAHFAKSQLWHASTLLFAFFLTEACRLNVDAMGGIMAGSLVLNGVVDATLGLRWRTRVVRMADALRLQAWGAPLTSLFFLLFCMAPLIQAEYRLVWALMTLLCFRASYSFIDVSQNAVVALGAMTDDARCALLARRNIASGLAALAVGGLAAPLLINGRGVVVWLAWAGFVSMLVCGSAWWLACMKTRAGEASSAIASEGPRTVPFVALLVALAVMMTGTATFRTLEPYYAAFAGNGTGLLLWAAIGGLAGQMLWFAGRHRLTMAGVLVIVALLLGLAAIGLLQATSLGAVVAGAGFGMGTGGLWLVLWSAMMNRAATGQPTGYVGIFTCVSKCAQATAVLFLSRVLSTSRYRDTLADPWSAPSMLMIGAVGAIGATSLALAYAFNRTAYDEKRATPRPTVRPDRVPS